MHHPLRATRSTAVREGGGTKALYQTLAAELDASRARERELEAAGQAASQALGRAIAGVRTALGD